jgi:hypothetical protein
VHAGVALIGDPGNDELWADAGQVAVHSLGCDGGTTAAPLVARPDVATLHAWPNPFRAGSVVHLATPAGSAQFVTGRDVRGARVRTFRGTDWEGLGDGGHPLPAGRYFLEARSGTSRARGQVVLLR